VTETLPTKQNCGIWEVFLGFREKGQTFVLFVSKKIFISPNEITQQASM
jgi:hypothetical protein